MKPERILIYWGLVAENGRGPYLAGLELNGGTRTSTPLVDLDIEAGTALTASGRRYRLQGAPHPAYALAVAKSVWGQYFDLDGSVIVALSPAEAQAMILANGNSPYDDTPGERAAYARRIGVPWDPVAQEVIDPLGSGSVWEDLSIPEPEDGEDDDLGPIGVVPEVKASLILSIRDSIRQQGLSVSEAAWIAGIEPRRLRAIVQERRVHGVSASALDKILEAIDEWQPMRNNFRGIRQFFATLPRCPGQAWGSDEDHPRSDQELEVDQGSRFLP